MVANADLQNDRALAEWLARAFKRVDWPVPPYLSVAFLSGLAHDIEAAQPQERLQIMQAKLAEAYSPRHLAAMFLERYSKIMHVRDFTRHIAESIRAYFSGYKLVAIIGLLPVVEGVVRRIALGQSRDIGQGTKKLKDEFQAFVDREIRSFHCFGERVVMLEALRDFVEGRLLVNTREYSGLNGLNRHGILHGIYVDFGEDINFFRLIAVLDLLCFAIGLKEGGSAFAPDETPESSILAVHYATLGMLRRIT
jgi:hypothetical protein